LDLHNEATSFGVPNQIRSRVARLQIFERQVNLTLFGARRGIVILSC
jgi:hypothetical protein